MNVKKETIKKIRRDKGLSQAEISEDLFMSQRQWSRYETGKSKINIWEFSSLMEQTGDAEADFWLLYLDTEEYEGYRLFRETRKNFDIENPEEAIALIEKLEAHPISKVKFVEKAVKHMRLKVDFYCNKNAELDYELLLKSLEKLLGVDYYGEIDIEKMKPSRNELYIIDHISTVLVQLDKAHESAGLMKKMLDNSEHFRLSQEEFEKEMPLLFSNYALILANTGNFSESIKILHHALTHAQQYESYVGLPLILCNLAVAYYEYGETEGAYRPYLVRAYYCALAMGRFEIAKMIKEEAAGRFRIEFD